jgi:hypothetical protein
MWAIQPPRGQVETLLQIAEASSLETLRGVCLSIFIPPARLPLSKPQQIKHPLVGRHCLRWISLSIMTLTGYGSAAHVGMRCSFPISKAIWPPGTGSIPPPRPAWDPTQGACEPPPPESAPVPGLPVYQGYRCPRCPYVALSNLPKHQRQAQPDKRHFETLNRAYLRGTSQRLVRAFRWCLNCF